MRLAAFGAGLRRRANVGRGLFALAAGAACTSSSSALPPADAGEADVSEAGPPDAANPFEPPDASTPDTAENACDALKQQVVQLGLLARACNPSLASQCTATTSDPCACPITVDIGNTQTVNDYDHAVAELQTKMDAGTCTFNCALALPCKTAPSNICQGSGTQGECQ
jgi:hypothetical protein